MIKIFGVVASTATFVVLFLGCSADKTVSTSEPLRGNCVGTIRDAGGALVVGARVLLVPEQYSRQAAGGVVADSGLDSTVTNDNGQYGFSVNAPGRYNVLAKKNNLFSMHQSIPISSHIGIELGDTLKAPGSVGGTIHLQGMRDHRSAIVLFIGTNFYTTPFDSTGRFSVPALAQGSYKVRLLTAEPDFAVVETTIVIASGAATALPVIELTKTTISMTDSLLTEYNPALMMVTLTWKLIDTALISGYSLYCNRTKNLTPLVTVDNSCSTQTFDLAFSPIDTFTYQVAAIGKSGLEGPALTGKTFVKTSGVTLGKMIRYPPPEVRLGGYSLFIDSDENIYLSTPSDIIKIDSTGAVLARYQIANDTDGVFQGSLKGDDAGNLYILKSGAHFSLVRFDANLHVRSELPLSGSLFSFAVSRNGLILELYNVSPSVPEVFLTDSNTKMTVNVYDSNFITLNDYDAAGEFFINYAENFTDTLITIEKLYQQGGNYSNVIFYRDNAFNIISYFNDFCFLNKYVPENFNFSCYNVLGPKGIIGSCYYQSGVPDGVLFILFNNQKQVLARIPGNQIKCLSGNFSFGKSGNLYVFPDDNENTHALYKYSTDQLFNTKMP
jgi:hypothetical protein